MNVSSTKFGELAEGGEVTKFRLSNEELEVELITFGARLTAIKVKDRDGLFGDVLCGYDALGEYVDDRKSFFGVTVGRYANRIGGGKFTLDGVEYRLPINNAPNTLHGGTEGFDRRNWSAREVANGVEFTLVSADGDQGFPGELTARATYTLEDATLRMEFVATTTKATVVNLTSHGYFNLAGEGTPSVLEHELMLASDRFVAIDEHAVPTGELRAVQGTAFDFTTSHTLGERIEAEDEQLKAGHGYDHTFVLRGEGLRECATLYEPASGRTMRVATTKPGVQLYTANWLDGKRVGKSGKPYLRRSAMCLETQHYPDSPNKPAFPSTVLRPGETVRDVTTLSFSAESK